MNRYVITYFSDPAEDGDAPQELKTLFIEGISEDDARDKLYARVGSFSQIMSCNLTKSCGGPGLFQTTVHIGSYNNVDLKEVPHVTEELEVSEPKKVKVVNRGGKVSNASLIRQKITEAKEQGLDKNFVVDWAVKTLGQTRPVAKSYVKNIWAE